MFKVVDGKLTMEYNGGTIVKLDDCYMVRMEGSHFRAATLTQAMAHIDQYGQELVIPYLGDAEFEPAQPGEPFYMEQDVQSFRRYRLNIGKVAGWVVRRRKTKNKQKERQEASLRYVTNGGLSPEQVEDKKSRLETMRQNVSRMEQDELPLECCVIAMNDHAPPTGDGYIALARKLGPETMQRLFATEIE